MLTQLEELYATSLQELERAGGTAALTAWYRAKLGRKGEIYLMTRQVGQLAPEERPVFGKRVNEVQRELQAAYEARLAEIQAAELQSQIQSSAIDVTLPGRARPKGGLHIITSTLREIYRVFGDMGFQIYRSREVERDAYNFEMLNFPPHHPAREMQDSFYTDKRDVILRTHTSPGQIRAMHEYHPEAVRVIVPGMCYRNEQVTARANLQFTQVEGLAVGRDISMAELKGTLTEFARRVFGPERQTRFRASYFPFTEPSAEMDVSCFLCDTKGCQLCKYTGWLEILGCGMVHPVVLRNGAYDPEEYTGFAFGMGPERIAMLKHGIEDIRLFWQNDLRFLDQF